MRDRMEAINALVKTGRTAMAAGNYGTAQKSFDSAVATLPAGEAKFAAQTYRGNC